MVLMVLALGSMESVAVTVTSMKSMEEALMALVMGSMESVVVLESVGAVVISSMESMEVTSMALGLRTMRSVVVVSMAEGLEDGVGWDGGDVEGSDGSDVNVLQWCGVGGDVNVS